jgi:beta-glucosidase
MKRIFWILCLALAAGCSTSHQQNGTVMVHGPWFKKSLPPEKRAKLLVKQMTLDEKISQIHMMDVREHPREVAGIPRLGVRPFKITNGPLGAGPGDVRGTLPATALPAALALAASWDTNLAAEFGTIAGEEVVAHGDDLIEGPGVNITRVPFNGRNFEYFGEDPFLSARLGVAEIRAIQAQGVIAEVKHFAANSQEDHRKSINEFIDERTLHEIYLPAFEAAVKEGHVAAVMAAYPSVNGEFCCRNTHLLTDILRDEWGFKGFVQSDYTAVTNGVQCARAGLDLSMKPEHFSDEIKTAITNGVLPESVLNDMVTRRFTQVFKFGIFDHPKTQMPIPAKEHGAIERSIAEQSAVLLKNRDNILPLDAKAIHSVAVIGRFAGAALTGGSGSSMVKPLYTISPVEGLTNLLGPNVTVTYNAGTNLEEAAALAKSADVALVIAGNRDGEGRDRTNLSLPMNQDLIISNVIAANPKTIVVLKTGGPVLMPWLDQVPAVLEIWYPGEEDGNVMADLLFGKANPSGKLPMTFPKTENETAVSTPQQYPGVNGDAIYSEKLLVGYRWYDAKNIEPLFPFGFGLSYTTFAVTNLTVTPYVTNEDVRVSVDVSNTGSRAGAEVVQVYVAAPINAGEPPKQLKGFAKVQLQPGETRRVTISLNQRAFSYWNTSFGEWVLAPGAHEILVGTSSRDLPLHASVTIPGTISPLETPRPERKEKTESNLL